MNDRDASAFLVDTGTLRDASSPNYPFLVLFFFLHEEFQGLTGRFGSVPRRVPKRTKSFDVSQKVGAITAQARKMGGEKANRNRPTHLCHPNRSPPPLI